MSVPLRFVVEAPCLELADTMISQRHDHDDVSLLSDLLSVSVSAAYQVLYSLID